MRRLQLYSKQGKLCCWNCDFAFFKIKLRLFYDIIQIGIVTGSDATRNIQRDLATNYETLVLNGQTQQRLG